MGRARAPEIWPNRLALRRRPLGSPADGRLSATADPGDEFLEAGTQRWVSRHDPEAVDRRSEMKAAIEEAVAALADLEDALADWEREEKSLVTAPFGDTADHYAAAFAASDTPSIARCPRRSLAQCHYS